MMQRNSMQCDAMECVSTDSQSGCSGARTVRVWIQEYRPTGLGFNLQGLGIRGLGD